MSGVCWRVWWHRLLILHCLNSRFLSRNLCIAGNYGNRRFILRNCVRVRASDETAKVILETSSTAETMPGEVPKLRRQLQTVKP